MIMHVPEYAWKLLLGIALLSYLFGSIPFGMLLTALGGQGDIRKIGSGNIGATNVLRTGRKDLAAATLGLDALKGVLAVLTGWIFCPPDFADRGMAIAAVSAVIGHCYPIWLGFKGGKGVATGLGAMLALSPLAGLAGCAVWLLGAKATKISSAGALLAFVAMPVVTLALHEFSVTDSAAPLAAFLISVLIFSRHHANISRILKGTEPKIGS